MKRSFDDTGRYRPIELIGLSQVKRERSCISKKREKKKILPLQKKEKRNRSYISKKKEKRKRPYISKKKRKEKDLTSPSSSSSPVG